MTQIPSQKATLLARDSGFVLMICPVCCYLTNHKMQEKETEVQASPPLALPNNGEMQATDSHVEVQTAPPLALPNNGEMQATPESLILAIPLLIAIVNGTPPTINASARLFNALARFTHELPHLIRTVRASMKKPKTTDKK